MGKAKRVRFLDDFINNSSNQEAAPQPRIIDAPKTSEYAFFKKIKKDAGFSYFRSRPEVDREGVEFHNNQPGQPVGGSSLSDTLKSSNPGAKFSSLAEKERNAKHYSFISPLRVAATKSASEWHTTDTFDKIKRSKSSLVSGKVTPADHCWFSPTASASCNEGNQYLGKGVFGEKRRKLHQRAVDTLFPELGEGSSKGFHVVSKLLGRLLPKGCENDDSELVEQKITDHLSTSPASYRSQNKVRMVHKEASMDLENEPSFDDINPVYFHGITKKNLASEREGSLAIYDTRADFLDYVGDPQLIKRYPQSNSSFWFPHENLSTKSFHIQELDEYSDPSRARRANFLDYVGDPELIRRYQQSNSSFWFPYENLSTKSFHIQELDEYSDPSRARKREPHNFLLDWDYKSEEEKIDAHDVDDHMPSTLRTQYSDPSRARKREPHNFLLDWDYKREEEKNDGYLPAHDVDDYMHSTLRTPMIGYKEQFIGDNSDEMALPSLSFRQICPKYDLLTYYQPNCFDTQDAIGLLEYDNQDDLEPRKSSPRLSFTPKYLTLEEESSIDNVLECDIANVVSDRPQHAVEPLLLSGGLDIDMAWKCLSFSSMPQSGELSTPYLTEGEFDTGLHASDSRKTYVPFSEDSFTHHEICSVTNISDRQLECHQLIDNSCWDEPYIPEDDFR